MNQGHNIYKTSNGIRKYEEEQCMKHTSGYNSKRSLHKEQSGPSLKAKLFLAFDQNSCQQYYLKKRICKREGRETYVSSGICDSPWRNDKPNWWDIKLDKYYIGN